MFVLSKVEVRWLLLMVCTCFVSCRQVNVAINKTTSTTSGVLGNWHPSGAVDGDHVTLDSPTSCFHSVRAPSNLTVDLGQRYQLYNITVYIRRGFYGRTENSIIYVDKDYSKACYTFPSTISDNPTRLTCNETARYVTIRNPGISRNLYEDSLNICEVEIYACTAGYRGVDCEADCHCEVCDRWTGICNSTCRPGWIGERCERACNGTYGTNCSNSCDARHCSNFSSSCDAVNGTCDSGCLPGWIGHDCIIECQNSTYGLNCSKNCTNRNCMDNSTCDPMTGSCSLGCQLGWKTIDCTKECKVGEEFGPNCSFPCNTRHCLNKSNCDPINGTCDYGCEIGWEGPQCLQALAPPPTNIGVGVIAGSTAAGVLVVLVLLLLTVFLIRCNKRKSANKSSGSKEFNQKPVRKERTNRGTIYENFAFEKVDTRETKKRNPHAGVQVIQLIQEASAKTATDNHEQPKAIAVKQIDSNRQENEENQEEDEEEEEDFCEIELLNFKDNSSPKPDIDEKSYYNLNQVGSRHVISVSQLPQRIKEMNENPSVVKHEYETLPQEFLYSYEESQKKENKGKNRFKGYYPYDYNRVVLDSEDGTDGDYINASYIDGYRDEKRYIAAQGPYKTELFEDFWRMIWHEGCTTIVMVTSLVEAGKMKCLRYWPEAVTEKYGRFTVTTEKTTQLADYTVTNLVVQHDQHSMRRHLKHFYFTGWSDHGVPDISSLLAFMRRVQNFTKGQQRPIVVHCSAGIGRTGTYIAVESLVNQVAIEGVVDVFSFITNMRGQRRNMVQTIGQYHFIYKTVAHAVIYGDTSLSVYDIKHVDLDRVAQVMMGNRTVEEHLKKLQGMRKGENPPEGFILLPSYRKRCGFTLMTSGSDREQIYNLVFKGRVRILVTDYAYKELFSPDSDVPFTKGRELSLSEDVNMSDVDLQTIQDGESTIQIQHYQIQGEMNERTVSVLTDSLLQGTGQPEGQTTAVVSSSETECGVLVLLVNLASRLKEEGRTDIIQEMTRLQQQLPRITFNKGHVRRCLEFAKRWIESFEMYANI